jgi:hypothetical protein
MLPVVPYTLKMFCIRRPFIKLFMSVIRVSLTTIRYTSSSGERRIRVHTAAAPVVTDLSEMYRQADTGAIVSLLARIGQYD